jgi:hypothetical protein
MIGEKKKKTLIKKDPFTCEPAEGTKKIEIGNIHKKT